MFQLDTTYVCKIEGNEIAFGKHISRKLLIAQLENGQKNSGLILGDFCGRFKGKLLYAGVEDCSVRYLVDGLNIQTKAYNRGSNWTAFVGKATNFKAKNCEADIKTYVASQAYFMFTSVMRCDEIKGIWYSTIMVTSRTLWKKLDENYRLFRTGALTQPDRLTKDQIHSMSEQTVTLT